MPKNKKGAKKGPPSPKKEPKKKAEKEDDDGWEAAQELLNEMTVENQEEIKRRNEAIAKATVYMERGVDCMKKSDFDNAVGNFTAATSLVPESSRAYFQLGCALFMNQDPKKGAFQLALAYDKSDPKQKNPSQFEILLNLGGAARMSKETLHIAVDAFKKALELNPKSDVVKSQLELAQEALKTKDDIKVAVPEGAKPGDVVTIQVDDEKLRYQLPQNAEPGGLITIQKRNQKYLVNAKGEAVTVTIPEGAGPGDTLRLKSGPMAGQDIVVPAGYKAGDKLEIVQDVGDEERSNEVIMDELRKQAKERLEGKAPTVEGMEWLDKALAKTNLKDAKDIKKGKKEKATKELKET